MNHQSGGGASASHMGSGETGISWASSPQAVLQNEPVQLCEKLRAKCTPDAATYVPGSWNYCSESEV